MEDGDDITVVANAVGQTVSQNGGQAQDDESPVIANRNSGQEVSNVQIWIEASDNATAHVTLDDLNITRSYVSYQSQDEGNIVLELNGNNFITGGYNNSSPGLLSGGAGNGGVQYRTTITPEGKAGLASLASDGVCTVEELIGSFETATL